MDEQTMQIFIHRLWIPRLRQSNKKTTILWPFNPGWLGWVSTRKSN